MVRKNPEYDKELKQKEKDHEVLIKKLGKLDDRHSNLMSKIDMLTNTYKQINVQKVANYCIEINQILNEYAPLEKELDKLERRLYPVELRPN